MADHLINNSVGKNDAAAILCQTQTTGFISALGVSTPEIEILLGDKSSESSFQIHSDNTLLVSDIKKCFFFSWFHGSCHLFKKILGVVVVTLSRLRYRRITVNDTFAVVLWVFLKGSLPFLHEGFVMFKTFALDELLIYIRNNDRELHILQDSQTESRPETNTNVGIFVSGPDRVTGPLRSICKY